MKTPRRYLVVFARRTKGGPVRIFHDSGCTSLFAVFDLHHPQRPRHGRKWITLNCYRYKLEWLPDAESVTRPIPLLSNPEPQNAAPKR